MSDRLQLVPVRQREAFAFVDRHHRHLPRPRGWLFGIGAQLGGELVGVACVGRPVSRHRDDGVTAEVIRLVSDGTRNVCSFLLGAACRAAWAIGYRKVITYTRVDEPGSSLRAAGFVLAGYTAPESWDRETRPRGDRELVARCLWVRRER